MVLWFALWIDGRYVGVLEFVFVILVFVVLIWNSVILVCFGVDLGLNWISIALARTLCIVKLGDQLAYCVI